MDERATLFLLVMAVLAATGILALIVVLIVRRWTAGRAREAGVGTRRETAMAGPNWYEYVLGLLLALILVGLGVWQVSTGGLWVWGEESRPWTGASRDGLFLIVMLASALIALVVFLAYAIRQSLRPTAPTRTGAVASEAVTTAAPTAEGGARDSEQTPSGLRLLGLLLLAVALLLLGWIHLPRESQFLLMRDLIYPAAFAVTLVLLFDKASRRWHVKLPAEQVREWVLCDGLAVLLVLGYFNLRSVSDPAGYAALFWDMLHLIAFFAIFWLLDRKLTRYRFLVAQGYLLLLPLLLLIWRAVQGVEVPAELSWWSGIWPFMILSGLFFLLEIVALITSAEGSRQVLPAIKDVLFVVLYAILLIVAIPAAASG